VNVPRHFWNGLLRCSPDDGVAKMGVDLFWEKLCSLFGLGPRFTAQDYVEIQELYSIYARAYDTNEGNGQVWAETFTPDGVFTFREHRAVGHKELAAYANSRTQTGPAIQHWNTNVIIRPAPGGATASLNTMVVVDGDGNTPPSIAIMTNYNDVLVKTRLGWRIKSRAGGPDIASIRQQARS